MAINGLVDSGYVYQKFDEAPRTGMRLGRNMWLDSRSLAHMVENDVSEMGQPFASTSWERIIPILDQKALGSCTANAGTGALGTKPFYDAAGKAALKTPGNAKALEEFAIALYSDATKVDAVPGSYPPEDTGSSGLGICKVLKERGTIKGYQWARTPYGFLRLLQKGPVLQGMPWYNAFYNPDKNGFIDSDRHWASSGIAGGHEIEAVGVEVDTRDVFDSVITYANSWGTGWGDSGYFRMKLRTYETLASVDLKQFTV